MRQFGSRGYNTASRQTQSKTGSLDASTALASFFCFCRVSLLDSRFLWCSSGAQLHDLGCCTIGHDLGDRWDWHWTG